MTTEPLEHAYFEWLAVQVVNTRLRNPRQTSWHLLKQLYTTEFKWSIHNDDNRVADGKELRSEFLDLNREQAEPDWMTQGCSFLEMLIALSRRLSFQTEGVSPAEWFWHLLGNVELHISDWDYESLRMHDYVDQVLQRLNNRTYNANGRGGLFPLHESDIDQTQVELWYQMNYYLLERG
jgi:hypothetical protein